MITIDTNNKTLKARLNKALLGYNSETYTAHKLQEIWIVSKRVIKACRIDALVNVIFNRINGVTVQIYEEK